jgi:hypothetical protein
MLTGRALFRGGDTWSVRKRRDGGDQKQTTRQLRNAAKLHELSPGRTTFARAIAAETEVHGLLRAPRAQHCVDQFSQSR